MIMHFKGIKNKSLIPIKDMKSLKTRQNSNPYNWTSY